MGKAKMPVVKAQAIVNAEEGKDHVHFPSMALFSRQAR